MFHSILYFQAPFFVIMPNGLNTLILGSNWGTENDPEFKGYHNGNSDPRGFGKT